MSTEGLIVEFLILTLANATLFVCTLSISWHHIHKKYVKHTTTNIIPAIKRTTPRILAAAMPTMLPVLTPFGSELGVGVLVIDVMDVVAAKVLVLCVIEAVTLAVVGVFWTAV